MGLLDRLFGRASKGGAARLPENVTLLPDRIWLTAEAKARGIASEASTALRSSEPPIAVLLAAHFEESLPPIQVIAERPEFDGRSVHVVTVEQLTRPFESRVDRDESQSVLVLVSERHPLRRHDEGVAGFAANLPCRVRLAFHLSLDDPALRAFTGEWVQSLLKSLGMSELEAIESPMVARRIATAQARIAAAAVADEPAGSVEEWFRRNCPRHSPD